MARQLGKGDYVFKCVEGSYLFWLLAIAVGLEIWSLVSPVTVPLSYITFRKYHYFQDGLICGLANPLEQGIP